MLASISHKFLKYIELLSIVNEVFPVLAEKGHFGVFKLDGYWIVIGQHTDYLRKQLLVENNMENTYRFNRDDGRVVFLLWNISEQLLARM